MPTDDSAFDTKKAEKSTESQVHIADIQTSNLQNFRYTGYGVSSMSVNNKSRID